ncbi:LptF/LptG family permease [Oscillatoria amoena NRMC-F 0135]|nr:LptF/LptG family permease [Oscillatoria amoena NRMC-F 0135]
MKKLDKLILTSFVGPFTITFLVVVFILLTQHMLKYFDDIIGKGLGWDVIGQLLFYFGVFMTPVAMPLAVLLSSLITFGNLGEHFELTAVKSAGISLLRAIQPIFFFVLLLTLIAFYVNNNLVPKAALEAYSLLYDIKQKKPALDLREGTFYNGIPDISIKVNKRYPDGITIKDILIYDHRKRDGNKEVTIADSGRMYTILNERYLTLELYNGYNYSEGSNTGQELAGKTRKYKTETFSRSKFSKTQVVFDLSSFNLNRTDKKWFQGNRIMRNLSELNRDIDSVNREILTQRIQYYNGRNNFFVQIERGEEINLPAELQQLQFANDFSTQGVPVVKDAPAVSASGSDSSIAEKRLRRETAISDKVRPTRRGFLKGPGDSVTREHALEQIQERSEGIEPSASETEIMTQLDQVLEMPTDAQIINLAASRARMIKSEISNAINTEEVYMTERRVFEIQWHKIIANSMACIAMFLIGAPLGAIIKKGGLGVPFLVSILFFIIYYLLTMAGEKWAKQGIVEVPAGVWAADIILLLIGLIFLRQARLDARLFDADAYLIALDKAKIWLIRKGILPQPA